MILKNHISVFLFVVQLILENLLTVGILYYLHDYHYCYLTVLIYLVNQLLNVHKSVLFLESDIGQSEFTAPGLVSLNILTVIKSSLLLFYCYYFYFIDCLYIWLQNHW